MRKKGWRKLTKGMDAALLEKGAFGNDPLRNAALILKFGNIIGSQMIIRACIAAMKKEARAALLKEQLQPAKRQKKSAVDWEAHAHNKYTDAYSKPHSKAYIRATTDALILDVFVLFSERISKKDLARVRKTVAQKLFRQRSREE